jgi:hypothetical protein
MSRRDWILLAAVLFAVPAVFAAGAVVDSKLEFGVLDSTWKSGAALLAFVTTGLYLVWHIDFLARWQRAVLMVLYAPGMFAFLAWLGLVIQFTFDDCRSQQTVATDREAARRPNGVGRESNRIQA